MASKLCNELWVELWVGLFESIPANPKKTNGGRYRIRTYDFHRVKMALYR